jgi:GrpB-like predicted nucleotidyltransferase (UPF0157 family)
MSLGLPKHKVVVVPYDPEWPSLYLEEQTRLRAALGDIILDIQHVGSTAVPGLDSKPVIDIGIAIADFEEGFNTIPIIAELGYNFRGEVGVPGRHFFIQGRPRTHHVHMSEITNSDWIERLKFRDHLRENPESAKHYAELKTALAQQFPDDITAYSNGKTNFILKILSQP